MAAPIATPLITCSAPLSSLSDVGLGEMTSALGPGAPTGGAGGPSSSGAGAGAACFLLFFLLGVGALAGASVGGAEAGAGGEDSAGGVAASGAGDGGD